MKIWIRLLLGIIIGVVCSIFLPSRDPEVSAFFQQASDIVIHIGRYLIFPLVFFSLAVGTFRLRVEKKLLSVYARTGILVIITSFILIIVGAISVLVLTPERIPIIIEEDIPINFPGFYQILVEIFPANLFQTITSSGSFILPITVLAVFLGLSFTYDKVAAEPAIVLFDSFSRVFYNLYKFLSEIMAIGFIFLTTYLILQTRSVVELELFNQLFVILAVDTVLVIFVLYPILVYFFCERKNPYRWLYGIIAPAVTGFISGDGYFSLGMLIRHGKENLGIPRKISSTTFPLYAILGHAGTALVACVSFIIILRSYSSLEITFAHIILSMMYTFAISFLLGPVPGKAAIVALFLLSSLHGRGLEEGFLILRPVAPLLISTGVLLDVVTSAFVSTVVAHQEDLERDVELVDFI